MKHPGAAHIGLVAVGVMCGVLILLLSGCVALDPSGDPRDEPEFKFDLNPRTQIKSVEHICSPPQDGFGVMSTFKGTKEDCERCKETLRRDRMRLTGQTSMSTFDPWCDHAHLVPLVFTVCP